MILILSNSNDETTHLIMQWLNYNKKQVIRINRDDLIDIVVNDSNIYFEVKKGEDKIKFNLSEIKSYWYRRGNFTISAEEFIKNKGNRIFKYIEKEHKIIKEFIHFKLKDKKSINSFNDNEINKLIVLEKAKECGLNVPTIKIFKSGNHLGEKLETNIRYITKPIWEVVVNLTNSKNTYSGTHRVNNEEVNQNNFNYSLFQEEVNKKYEIRSFFINETFFSMAIFSQGNEKTSVDFRNYDDKLPNRMIPYKLPKEIEMKLTKLMKKLKLVSGSIDLIKAPNDYYFLEVNPVGQFGMVSIPCNYLIEKKIAEIL